MSSPPSASLGSDGVTATLYEDHLTLSDGNEDVTLTMEEVLDLVRFLWATPGVEWSSVDKPLTGATFCEFGYNHEYYERCPRCHA